MMSSQRIPIARALSIQEPAGVRMRIAAVGVSLACAAVLALAAYLSPDPSGMGTHQGIGLPPCGFVISSGLPCPTCGMTTSFSLMMHARPISAFVAQPAGALLCLVTVVAMILSMKVALTGRMVRINWYRVNPVHIVVGFGLLLMGAWGFKLAYGLITGILPAR